MPSDAVTLYGYNNRPVTADDYPSFPLDDQGAWGSGSIAKRDRSLAAFISPWQMQRGITAPETFHLKDLLEVYANGAIRNVHVYAAVRAKSGLAMQIPLTLHKFEKRMKGDRIDDHPTLRLLDKVNPQATYMDWMEAGTSFLELGGNFFCGLENPDEPDNPAALPTEMWPLRPDLMSIIPSLEADTFGQIKKYQIQIGADRSRWPTYTPSQMLQIKYFSPLTPYWGLPPLTAARLTLLSDHYQQKFVGEFFKNGMHVGGILTSDYPLQDADFRRFQEEWRIANQGLDQMHHPLVLPPNLKWNQTTQPPKDVEFVEGQKINKHIIVGEVYGMSPMAIGDYSDASVLQNADAMNASDWRAALRVVQRIANGLNEFLLPRYPAIDGAPAGEFLRFYPDTSDISAFQENEGSRATNYSTLVNAGWPVDRALKRIYPDEEAFEPTEPTPALALPIAERLNGSSPVEKITEAERITRSYLLKVALLSDAFATAMKPGFEEWAQEVAKQAEPALVEVLPSVVAASITRRSAVARVMKAVDFVSLGKTLGVALDPAYVTTAALAIGLTNEGLELAGVAPVSFNLVNPKVTEVLQKESLKLIKSVTKTVKEDLRSILIASMQEGEGIPILTQKIKSAVEAYQGVGQTYRAERVARTESINAMAKASQATYIEAGIKKNGWLDTGDDKEDELCFELAAMEPVLVGEEFKDGIVAPPAHPACRCALSPIVSLK